MAGGVVLDENNCYICSLELRYGVMVALQILVLSAQVRILVPQLSLRGISPSPCACAASAPSQPRHFVTAPFRGKPARQAFAGRLRCSFASQTRYRSAAPLVRPLRESLSDFAEAGAIPITVTRQPYVVAEQSARLGCEWSSLTAFQLHRA